jgi:hypothetical protein
LGRERRSKLERSLVPANERASARQPKLLATGANIIMAEWPTIVTGYPVPSLPSTLENILQFS